MKIWTCEVCGWSQEGGEIPEVCPRCGVGSDEFKLTEVPDPPVSQLSEEDKKRISPAMYRISYGLFLVGSGTGDKINAQIANTVFQITNSPMRIAIGINQGNYTHELIKESGVFTIGILGQDNYDLVGKFGFKSGREVNKFADQAYRLGVTKAPIVDECIAWLECKVDPSKTLDLGSHSLFIGDVVEGGTNQGEPLTYALYRQLKKTGGVNPGSPPAKVEVKAPAEKKWRCEVCGYIHTGANPPEECPICGVGADKFVLES